MSFPKDLSLGLKCYMLGTCQKLAFWQEFDTDSFQSALRKKNQKCSACQKNTDSILFPSAQEWLKEEEHGLLSSLEKIRIPGLFLGITW